MYEIIISGISLQHCFTDEFCSVCFLCFTYTSDVIHYASFYNCFYNMFLVNIDYVDDYVE